MSPPNNLKPTVEADRALTAELPREISYPIIFRDVSFAYEQTPVLQKVSLAIEAREAVCIVGPNGGGKSTLLKLILGLIEPSAGEILLFGQKPRKTRGKIGYMPQHLYVDFHFPITVLDIVLMGRLGCKKFGFYSRKDIKIAREQLEAVELDKLSDSPFSSLSGGQRQRALIARALACEPEALLLDEPTASVDMAIEARFYHMLEELNQRMAILIVTHDLGFVSKFVQTVICVNRTVAVHPTSQVTGEVIQDIYGCDLNMIRHDHRCSSDGHCYGR